MTGKLRLLYRVAPDARVRTSWDGERRLVPRRPSRLAHEAGPLHVHNMGATVIAVVPLC
jgi:hypothetical protein